MYEIDLLKGFVLHLLDATINLVPEAQCAQVWRKLKMDFSCIKV